MNQDQQEFVDMGARVRRALGIEQRRLARTIGASIRARGEGQATYTALTHAFVMVDVDRALDQLYGEYRGDPRSKLLQLITRHARAAWLNRIERLALLGGGLRDESSMGPDRAQ